MLPSRLDFGLAAGVTLSHRRGEAPGSARGDSMSTRYYSTLAVGGSATALPPIFVAGVSELTPATSPCYCSPMTIFRETLTHVAPHLGLIYSMPVDGGPTEVSDVRELTAGEVRRRWGGAVADALSETYPEIPRDLPAVQRAEQYRAYASCCP